jgi:hypothetical protein
VTTAKRPSCETGRRDLNINSDKTKEKYFRARAGLAHLLEPARQIACFARAILAASMPPSAGEGPADRTYAR